MNIEIQLQQDSLTPALNRLIAAGSDLSPAMRAITGVLSDEAEHAFEYEVNPSTGEHWAGLFNTTIKQRTKKGHWPGQILQQSGQLAASIQSDYGSDFARIGSNKKYAAAHQLGSEVNHLEARPFLGLSPEGEQEILSTLQQFLQSAL